MITVAHAINQTVLKIYYMQFTVQIGRNVVAPTKWQSLPVRHRDLADRAFSLTRQLYGLYATADKKLLNL